jgi:DNA-directed RNA polymerase specialized sigma24 family protein
MCVFHRADDDVRTAADVRSDGCLRPHIFPAFRVDANFDAGHLRVLFGVGSPDVLVALDEALHKLAVHDARKAELVKLRFFAGLTIRQAADALDISESTADADWAYAKSWLCVQIAD